MGECISYFEGSPLPYYNIYICTLRHFGRTENAFNQYFSLGSVKKLTKTQGFTLKVYIICIMDAFWIWIHQLRIPPFPGLLAIVRKFTLDGGVLSDNSDIRISRMRYSCPTTNYLTISSSISFINILLYTIIYYIYIYPSPLSYPSPTQHIPYPSPTLLKFNFNSIPSPLYYYNLYHSPQFPLYLSLHF